MNAINFKQTIFLFTLVPLISVVTGCSSTGSGAIDKLLGHFSSAPILNSISSQTVAQEDLLKIDVNNIVNGAPGNDEGMTYKCIYDTEVDSKVSSDAKSCSDIPDSTVNFDPATGILTWTPHGSVLGNYEVKVSGSNTDGSYEQIFTVGVRLKFNGIGLYTQITGTSATANWTPNLNAQGYQVFKLNQLTGQYELFRTITGGSTSGISLTGLAPNTPYTLRVQAVDALGNLDGNVVSRSFTTTELVKIGMTSSATTLAAGSTAVITVQAFNANDSAQTVGGLPISASITSGTSSGNFSPVVDNDDGTYTFSFTPTSVGTPIDIEVSTNITFFLKNKIHLTINPGPANSTNSSISISSGTVISGNSVTVTANVRDTYNNPITSPTTLVFNKVGGTSTGTLSAVNNQGNGVYSVTYTGITAGTAQVLSLTVDGINLTPTTSIQVLPGTPVSSKSDVIISSTSVSSGSSAQVTATLRDINNNPVSSGILVAFAKSGGTSSGTFDSVVNVGSGVYTTNYTGVVAGTAQTITVSVDGVTLIPSVAVAVVPGPASLGNSSFTLTSATVISGNFVTATATLKDANNNPIDSGVTVNFTKSGGTSTGTFGAVTNQGNGVYNIRYTAIKSGTAQQIGLELGGVAFGSTLSLTVLNGSPSPSHSTLTLSSATVLSGAPITVTATVKDDNDNLISSGVAITFAKAGGTSTGTFGAINNVGGGVYTTTYTGVVAGTAQTISLLVDGSALGPSATVTVNVGAPSAANSTLVTSANPIVSGQTATITATIRDSNNNPIGSGIAVTFTKSGGTATGTFGSVTNQGAGIYTIVYTGVVAGTAQTMRVFTDGTDLGLSVGVAVNVGSPSLANSSLALSSGTVLSGNSITITGTVRDLNNNPITTGVAITYSKTGGTSTGTFGSVTNAGSGVYTTTYTGVAAGTAQTISLLTDGSPLGLSATVTVGVGAPYPANSTLTISSGSVVSGQNVIATATIKDINNNPVTSGVAVTFTKANGTSTGTFGSVTNQGAGVYTVTYTGVVAGTPQDIKAYTDGNDLTYTVTVGVVPAAPSAANSSISLTSNTVTSGSSVTATATIKDLNNNPITTGVAVTFSKTGGTSTGTFGSITNVGSGVYTTTYTGVTAGSAQTINILADGFNLGPTASITVTPGAPSSLLSTLTISANTVIAGQFVTLTATIKDANNNPITTGALITFDKIGGTSFGNYGTVVNQGSGIYTVTYTGVTAGTAQTVQANVDGSGFGPTQSIQVLVGAPATAQSSLSLSSNSILSGAVSTITAVIRDSQNNPITNQYAITFDAIGGSSTGTISAVNNAGNGTFTATYTGTIAGTAQTIRVLADGSPISGLTAALTVTPGAPSAVNSTFTIGTSNVQSGTSTTLSINLRDANNNAITTGATVTFSKSAGVSDGTIGTVNNTGNGNYNASYTGTTMGAAQTIGLVVNSVAVGMTVNVTVSAGPPTHFAAVSPVGAIPSIDCNGPYSLTLKDVNENTTTSTSVVNIALASNPVGSHLGTIFTDSSCTNSVTSLTIPISVTNTVFYYKSYTPKNFTLGMNPGGSIATTNIVINNAAVLAWMGAGATFSMNGSGANTVGDDTTGGSLTPYDTTISGNYMYVTDNTANRIVKYDISTNAMVGWIGHVGSLDSISTYDGTTTCEGLSVAAADLTPKWCNGGRSNTVTAGLINAPKGIASDSTYIYVVSGHRILRFLQSDGSYQGWFGKINSTAGMTPASCVAAGTGATTPTWCFGGTTTTGTADGQFNTPTGLTTYDTGTNVYLYVAESSNHRVQRIDVTSATAPVTSGWVGQAASVPPSSGQLATCSSQPAINAATPGWCLGGTSKVSNRRQDGVASASPGPEAAAPAEGFYSPQGVTTDGTYLYVADYNNYRIVRINLSTGAFSGWVGYLYRVSALSPVTPAQSQSTYTNTWTQGGVTWYSTGVAGFYQTIGMKTDGTYLYMTDGSHRLQRIRVSDGQDYRWIGRTATSPTGGYTGCSSTPVGGVTPGWCLGGAGNKAGNTNGAFYNPIGIAATSTKIYVVDSSNFRVQRFNKVDGTFDGWIGAGNIPASKWSRAIPSGTIASRWGIDDYSLGDVTAFNGVALNSNFMFETDSTFARIKKFNKADGSIVGYVGQISVFPPVGPDSCVGYTSGMTPDWCVGGGRTAAGSGIMGFNNPYSLAADATYVYIGNYSNNRIDRVRISDGLYLGWIGKVNTVPTDGDPSCMSLNVGDPTSNWCIGGTAAAASTTGAYNAPRSMYSDTDNSLIYVSDASSRLLRIRTSDGVQTGMLGSILTGATGCTITGSTSSGWCTAGTGAGALNTYGGINVGTGLGGNSTYLYVADQTSNRLLRFDKTSGAPSGFIAKVSANTNMNLGGGATNPCNGMSFTVAKVTPGWCYANSIGVNVTTIAGPEGNAFNSPRGVAADDSNIYVADTGNNRVVKIAVDGTFVGWRGYITSTTGMTDPDCIAAGTAPGGSMITPKWCVGGTSGPGKQLGAFDAPTGINVDENYVYVMDGRNNRTITLPK